MQCTYGCTHFFHRGRGFFRGCRIFFRDRREGTHRIDHHIFGSITILCCLADGIYAGYRPVDICDQRFDALQCIGQYLSLHFRSFVYFIGLTDSFLRFLQKQFHFLADLGCHMGGIVCQMSDLFRDYGKASAGLACSGGLNRSI